MTTREQRRRARAITKAQRSRKQEKLVARAAKLLVESSENRDVVNMSIAPGASIRAGDMLYISREHPGCVTSAPGHEAVAPSIGVAIGSSGDLILTGGVIAVRLRELHG